MSPLAREAHIPGRIVVSWTMSGGILFGLLGTILTVTDQVPGFGLFTTLAGFFVFGSLVGMAHGFVLAVFAKEKDVPFSSSVPRAGMGVLYSLLASPVSFLATMWLGFSVYYRLDPSMGRLIGAIIGGWIGLVVLVWTAWETWKALRVIVTAWPDFLLVAGIVAVVFLVLVWFFSSFYPYLFEGSYNIRQAVFLAGGISVLVVGPVTTLAVIGLRRMARLQRLLKEMEQGNGDAAGERPA